MDEGFEVIMWGFVIICIITGLFLFFGVLIPMMSPWWSTQSGKAELAKAEQNRQIAVLEAQAKLDSASKLADAEVARARGVAESNIIIADSITEPYLRYLYINGLTDNLEGTQIIYIPTEAGLPILEANRI